MKRRQYKSVVPALSVMLLVMLFGVVPPAHAIDQISVENLQAAVRTLSFLESLPKEESSLQGSSILPTFLPPKSWHRRQPRLSVLCAGRTLEYFNR
jgi:hypothetical protein